MITIVFTPEELMTLRGIVGRELINAERYNAIMKHSGFGEDLKHYNLVKAVHERVFDDWEME